MVYIDIVYVDINTGIDYLMKFVGRGLDGAVVYLCLKFMFVVKDTRVMV